MSKGFSMMRNMDYQSDEDGDKKTSAKPKEIVVGSENIKWKELLAAEKHYEEWCKKHLVPNCEKAHIEDEFQTYLAENPEYHSELDEKYNVYGIVKQDLKYDVEFFVGLLVVRKAIDVGIKIKFEPKNNYEYYLENLKIVDGDKLDFFGDRVIDCHVTHTTDGFAVSMGCCGRGNRVPQKAIYVIDDDEDKNRLEFCPTHILSSEPLGPTI
jgi:hypothetical protein